MNLKELVPNSGIRNYVGPFSDVNFYYELGLKQSQLVINELGILPQNSILDVSCGCGRLAIHLTEFVTGTYSGIDNNHELIQFCIDEIHSRFNNFKFWEMDVYNKAYADNKRISATHYTFDFQSESIDHIVCWSVFTHMPMEDCISYIREFARILKKGGTGIVSFNLRNSEIDALIDSGKTKIPMIHHHGAYSRTLNEKLPEDCFAHSEEIIVQTMAETGMKIRKIVYGNWSKTHNDGEFHDYIIFEKPSSHIISDQ